MATTTSTFKLYKSLIYETVKNETHIAAHVARAMDKNAAELAFQEEAGDESYHERKLERTLYSSLDKIKAEIIDYLNSESDNSNNLTCTIGADEITFVIILSSRFNTSYLTPLADLISKYVEDSMLFEWWTPINQNNAKIYAEKMELARLSILKCFIKNAPAASSYDYSDVKGSTDGSKGIAITGIAVAASTKEIGIGDNVRLAYTLTPSEAEDEVFVTSSDKSVVTAVKLKNGVVTVIGNKAGTATVAIASASNVSINATCAVTVS